VLDLHYSCDALVIINLSKLKHNACDALTFININIHELITFIHVKIRVRRNVYNSIVIVAVTILLSDKKNISDMNVDRFY